MRYKAVIFDLDGTVLYTLEDLSDALNFALRSRGFPERTLDEARNFIGNGIRNLVSRALPAEADDSALDEVYAEFMRHYADHCADKTRPYEGIERLLLGLRAADCRTAMLSNKADVLTKQLAQRFFPGLLDEAVGERAEIPRKPAPDSLLLLLKQLGVSPRDAVLVGDSDVDVLTARNAGIACISVGWGYRSAEQLAAAGASETVGTPPELAAALGI